MLKHVSTYKIPTTICTMYNPNFPDPEQQCMCETGLRILNDAIITQAVKVFIYTSFCDKDF